MYLMAQFLINRGLNKKKYYSFIPAIKLLNVNIKPKGFSYDILKLSSFIVSNLSIFTIILNMKRIKKKVKRKFSLFYLLVQKKKRKSRNFRYKWTGVNYLLRSVMSLTKHSIVLMLKLKHYWRRNKPYYLIMNRIKGHRFSKLVVKSMKHVEPVMLLKFLVFAMNNVEFVQHRWMLKRLMWQFDYGFDTKYLLSGLMLVVFGKINVGGNSRTRTLSYINGIRANSKSWLRGNRYADIVHTTTGCLGISLAYFL